MSPRYRVRNLVCESGERLPLLLDGTTGAPLFEPTLFVLTELRALNRASATLAQATRAVMVGKLVLDHLGVDLGARFAEGRVSLKPAAAHIAETVLRLYSKDPLNTQVLCARRNGPDCSKRLNALCQAALTSEATQLRVWSESHEAYAHTGFHVGDPVLCTRNLWDRGLQNGSLGVVVQIEEEPRMLTNEAGEESGLALAWVDWDDGVRRPIVEDMLDDLELGYAITVHKAQGSQWPRVVVPLTGHRLLDRTLVYTAVTRAQKQVLLVGDEAAARHAVESLPRVQSRQVALDLTLKQCLASRSEGATLSLSSTS